MAPESLHHNEATRSVREHIRVVAVIQAQVNDAHAGIPPLWHIVDRLKSCRLLEEIAVATSTSAADDGIVEWCNLQGIAVMRGPTDDTLARYARAAERLDADIIVQVSSDEPFPDPGLVDHLVASLIEQDGDYVVLEDDHAHHGVDVFSRRALDRLMMDAAEDPAARAQVTGYFRLHPDFVKTVQAHSYTPVQAPFALESPDLPRAVPVQIEARPGKASPADLWRRLERDPDLKALAAPVEHKPAKPGSRAGQLALIRCDGGGKYGYGHVKRMVALARALRDREGIGALFALNGSDDAAIPIRRAGFEVAMTQDLQGLVEAHSPDMLLLDGREGPTRAELEKIRRGIAVTAVIDDAHERRLACDYAYYPPVPGALTLDWSMSRTLPRIGWEWSILGLNPATARNHVAGSRPTVLVAMGGSDPHGLTLRMGQALTVLDSVYRIRFVIGTGMKNADTVAQALVALKSNYETIEGAHDLATEYASADVAVCAFGVTAYELAACGVPAIYLGLSEDHVASASAFADAGMGFNLGAADGLSDADIARTVQWLLNKPAVRRQMRKQGLAHLDGEGASRIAADLAAALAAARAPLKTAL